MVWMKHYINCMHALKYTVATYPLESIHIELCINFVITGLITYGTDLMQRHSFACVRARGHASPSGSTLELE